MNINQSTAQAKGKTGVISRIGWKALLRFVIVVLLQPVVLFIAAGRLNWMIGWAYVGVFVVLTAASRLILMRKYPDLIIERAQSLEMEDVKASDKAIVALLAIYGPLVTVLVAGLDERFGWSPQMPLVLQLLALVVATLGILLGTWAMLENKFFSAVVRVQKDRNQIVVTTGPYRFVRHPSYSGGIAAYLALPFMLSALWALIPAGLIVLGYLIRTVFEDKTLLDELDGYPEYARRVQYRLLPGVW